MSSSPQAIIVKALIKEGKDPYAEENQKKKVVDIIKSKGAVAEVPLKDADKKAKESAEKAEETVKEAVEEAADAVDETVEEAEETVEEAVEEAEGAIEEDTDKVVEEVLNKKKNKKK